MVVGSTYASMPEFRVALSQHAIKHEFEFNIAKSAPKRFRAYCSRRDLDNCPWWIFASTTQDESTVQVKRNPSAHGCSSTRRKKDHKNATRHWICAKVKDFLIVDATLRAKELRKKIKEHHKVNINYKRVFDGKKLALKQLYGDWDSSFDNLYRFKAQVEVSYPSSLVIIDHHTVNGKIRFRRFFLAFKSCIDGFLNGCRPYLAIDSTFLTGQFKGQLASACAVDGHNWLYPVCIGVFDSETNENWIWFLSQLRQGIGSPPGLAICTDAGQAVMTGVGEVFPGAEHRECMFHLVSNFKKRFHGKVFDDHLWAATYSWNPYLFEKHWDAMDKAKPAATDYLRKCHKKLWTRSQFRTICKHALAFITSLSNAPIEQYVDMYYCIEKFRVAYSQLIPAMPDKSQWPKSTHDFFMHPPLLKPVAGRPKTERHKGNSDNKRRKGQHQCPICMDYGHHWHSCKRERPEDIAAMKAIKGEPKKRAKNNKSAESSIMPLEEASSASMSFPPSSQSLETTANKKRKRKSVDCTPETSKSQSLEISSKKKGKFGSSNSGASKRSRSGSNQPEALSVDFTVHVDQPRKAKTKKVTFKTKKKELGKKAANKLKEMLDSPAMATRSKTLQPASPVMSTRSKRRLSL